MSQIIMPEDLPRPPTFATRPTPGLRNRLVQVEKVARALGRPLKPHQRYIAQIGTEMNPPGSHYFWRYQMVVLLLPRQTGKTTVLRPILADRCINRDRTQVVMSAQLGKDSADRWEDLIVDIEDGPLGKHLDVKRGKGNQVATWPNRSTIKPFTPSRDGVHGNSPNVGLLDEIWAFSKAEMSEVLTALRPSMITKRDRQLWLISAAGDASSEYLNDLTDTLAETYDQPGQTTAVIAYMADEDADPYDPATWEFHPGLPDENGENGLITLEDLANEAKPENNTHAEFLRSYMNRRTKARNAIIDLDVFDRLVAEQAAPDPSTVALAYDVAIDRTQAAIWAAWVTPDGKMHLRGHSLAEGDQWLYAATPLLRAHPGKVYADDGGNARVVTDNFTRAGLQITTLPGRDSATAWALFKKLIADGDLDHDGNPALRDALEVAAEARRGSLTILDRKMSLGPIDPLIAAVVACWYAARMTPTIQIF